MDNILVTGGAGFIGSHTCLCLQKKGYKIHVIDSLINSCEEPLRIIPTIIANKNQLNINNIEIYKGDLRDKNFISNIFSKVKSEGNCFKGVFHFAGLKSVKESILNPIKYLDFNLYGTINLLDVMQIFDCKNIVFSSSATVYGNNNNDKISENSPINPINPYGSSKVAVEKLLEDVFNIKKNDWRISCLRYFNPVGAHESGLIGEHPKGHPNNLFPLITQVAIGEIKEINIMGDNWPTLDGTCVRDYIHVMDLAEAHVMAFEYILNNDPQIIYLNLGTGKGTSVLNIIKTFEAVNNLKLPFKIKGRRLGDVPSLIADNKLALSKLKWKPKRNLEDMCRDGWRWQKLNPYGYLNKQQ